MPRLNLADLDRNDTVTVEKVYAVIEKTDSKRELAKAMAYGAAWGSGTGRRDDGYVIYNAACARARKEGHEETHVDGYLPESWLNWGTRN